MGGSAVARLQRRHVALEVPRCMMPAPHSSVRKATPAISADSADSFPGASAAADFPDCCNFFCSASSCALAVLLARAQRMWQPTVVATAVVAAAVEHSVIFMDLRFLTAVESSKNHEV